MKPLGFSIISDGHLFRRPFVSCMVTWLVIGLPSNTASDDVRRPSIKKLEIGRCSIEELVDNADLIIIGRVDSIRMTFYGLCRQIGLTSIAVLAPLLTFMAWRKRGKAVACFVAVTHLIAFLFVLGPQPSLNYHKVACVSVSRTIKGSVSEVNIRVLYDQNQIPQKTRFLSEEPIFCVQQDYLVFLDKDSCGYTVSFPACRVWSIEQGCVQTMQMRRLKRPPINLNRLVSEIKLYCDKRRDKEM
ncbi:MAG: hypothetical protein ACQESR_05770 [Planctomycetota bacterium]